jgi:hypothetical protein
MHVSSDRTPEPPSGRCASMRRAPPEPGAEARAAARKARRQILIFAPLTAAVLLACAYRSDIAPGSERYVRYGVAIALLILGWVLARDLGRSFGPQLLRRLDPATAGTVGFLIRLFGVLVSLVAALRIAGLNQRDLAVGGAFTAVVLGLAAQQTLANVFAGMVLLSARPFRVGERVRFQAGNIAGATEGTVESLGLMYVTMRQGADTILLPNSAARSGGRLAAGGPGARGGRQGGHRRRDAGARDRRAARQRARRPAERRAHERRRAVERRRLKRLGLCVPSGRRASRRLLSRRQAGRRRHGPGLRRARADGQALAVMDEVERLPVHHLVDRAVGAHGDL